MNIIKSLLFCLIVSLSLSNEVYSAFSFQIASASASIITSIDEEIIVSLLITDLPSESYFRVGFQKNDGGSYFGYLKNDLGEWVKTSDSCTKFFHVTDKALSKLEIPLKIGDADIEPGIYNIKSHRYTLSCSSTLSTNQFPIEIISSSPTPTILPTQVETQAPSPTTNEVPTITPVPISFENVFISEAMVHPKTGENEWVEIYNGNNFDVELIDWFIDDVENGGTTPKKFSLNIPAKSYKAIIMTSNIFNDSGDIVRLLDFNKNAVDSFEYAGSTEDFSYGRISLEDNNYCLQTASFEIANNSCFEPTLKPTPTEKLYSKYADQTNPTEKKTQITLIPTVINPSIKRNLLNNERILGASTKASDNIEAVKTLSFVSFSYSLLTILSVLFKMKIIYGRFEKIFSSFIYSHR